MKQTGDETIGAVALEVGTIFLAQNVTEKQW